MKRVILIGLSGAGKSRLADELSARLGFEPVDTDDEIVRIFGCPISEIFARFGERVFRAAERQVLERACSGPNRVIATGGGAVLDPANWVAMRPDSLIVHLQSTPEELIQRIRAQVDADSSSRRPLLDSADPVSDLNRLWMERRAHYERADATIKTTGKSLREVADEAEQLARAAGTGLVPLPIGTLGVPTGRSDLYVAPGALSSLGHLLRQRFPEARRSWIITDTNVGPLWFAQAEASLTNHDLAVERIDVPAGEASKSLARTSELLDRLLHGRIDRRDVVVALGGGVVGDLAGFVASIVLRGVGLVQVPTSLLAMVDSSVGGKTGIDHARGKNLIGAFYQPQLVIADPMTLETLPEREWRAGWAEIVKHAMIERSAAKVSEAHLLSTIEKASDDDLYDVAFMAGIVAQNVQIKRSVVQGDEREAGARRMLNYGHTLGHAMEASGYRYLHGEAIALGMRAAADLAHRLGRTSQAVIERQNTVLDRLGLPSRFEGELTLVMERIWSDKKAVHGALTWILPGAEAGEVDIVSGVPVEQVEAVACAIGARR